MLGMILVIVVNPHAPGSRFRWSHSKGWGYYPSGGIGFVLTNSHHSDIAWGAFNV